MMKNGDVNLAKEIGQLQGKMEAHGEAIDELRADVKKLLRVMNEARGGWRTLLLVTGLAGAVGAVTSKALPALTKALGL